MSNLDPKSRYYDAGGIEVQEIIKAKLTPEQYAGFCLGNIIKYSCRSNFKGDFSRDIEKVGFYQGFLGGGKVELGKVGNKEVTCPTCKGVGGKVGEHNKWIECESCDGSGKILTQG